MGVLVQLLLVLFGGQALLDDLIVAIGAIRIEALSLNHEMEHRHGVADLRVLARVHERSFVLVPDRSIQE